MGDRGGLGDAKVAMVNGSENACCTVGSDLEMRLRVLLLARRGVPALGGEIGVHAYIPRPSQALQHLFDESTLFTPPG